MTGHLDHGILNVPLSKRVGDIDAQIDRYKADQRRAEKATAKAQAAQTRADRERAMAMIDALPAARITSMAANLGLTVAQVRKQMRNAAYLTPATLIRAMQRDAAK